MVWDPLPVQGGGSPKKAGRQGIFSKKEKMNGAHTQVPTRQGFCPTPSGLMRNAHWLSTAVSFHACVRPRVGWVAARGVGWVGAPCPLRPGDGPWTTPPPPCGVGCSDLPALRAIDRFDARLTEGNNEMAVLIAAVQASGLPGYDIQPSRFDIRSHLPTPGPSQSAVEPVAQFFHSWMQLLCSCGFFSYSHAIVSWNQVRLFLKDGRAS